MKSYVLVLYEETNNGLRQIDQLDFPGPFSLIKKAWRRIKEETGGVIGFPSDGLSGDISISIEDDTVDVKILTEGALPMDDIELIDDIPLSPIFSDKFTEGAEENMSIDRKTKGRADTNVHILIREEALRKAKAHAQEDTRYEVGGVLLGRFIPLDVHQYVVVTGVVRALKAVQGASRLNFTPETWADILCAIDNDPEYGDEEANWRVVGWYHTHPSFGAFFSSWDIEVHKEFRHPSHIALVIDPIRDEEAYFCWDREQKKVIGYPEEHVLKANDAALIDLLESKGVSLAPFPKPEITEITDEQADVPVVRQEREQTRPTSGKDRGTISEETESKRSEDESDESMVEESKIQAERANGDATAEDEDRIVIPTIPPSSFMPPPEEPPAACEKDLEINDEEDQNA
jgi:proteasome lid subunit RPN8/RPN11